jgi:hypothetical protein
MRKEECKICGQIITANNIKKHQARHESGSFKQRLKIPDHVSKIDGFYNCWCCEEFKSKTIAGILSHVWRKHTDDGMKVNQKLIGRKAWNKGLTKETNAILADQAKRSSIKMKKEFAKGLRKNKGPSKTFRERLSIEQSTQNRGGKCRWFEVNGIKVQGTWEKYIAEKLTEFEIVWIKPSAKKDIWTYIDDSNQHRSYSPDFFLEEYQIWLEVKGYWWGDDKRKMQLVAEQYPERSILLIEKKEFDLLKEDFNNFYNLIH